MVESAANAATVSAKAATSAIGVWVLLAFLDLEVSMKSDILFYS